MQGRKSDFISTIDGFSTARCAFCRKKFRRNLSKHAYRRIGFGTRKDFCSYSCMTKWDKQQQQRDRMTERSAKSALSGRYERKTLDEWAREAEVDYEKLWEMNILSKISIPEAIYMLQAEDRYDREQKRNLDKTK